MAANGIGLNDLVFYSQTGSKLAITTIFGAALLPRYLGSVLFYDDATDKFIPVKP